jgi:hypothetical protein
VNPINLIRELESDLDAWTTGLAASHRSRELLRRARAFLDAKPVVVEVGECGIVAGSNKKRWLVRDADRGRFNVLDLGLQCPEEPSALGTVAGNTEWKNTIPCTVHVVVVPGVR